MKLVAIALAVVYYFLIVAFGAVLLAAAQLRSSTGATFDTWRLNYEANRALNETLSERLRIANEKTRNDSKGQIGSQGCLRFFDEHGLLRPDLIDPETAKSISEAREKHTDISQLIGDVSCIVKGFSWVTYDISHYKMLVESDSAETSELRKSLTGINEDYTELIKGHNDFLAFKEMEKVWYLRPFVLAPYDLLVLLLVVFMGALGGVVRLLRDFGTADKQNPVDQEYLFVPMIGAVVAVGGYVLAMTGLLLLSSARAESSLSPFMISLVGIISGLLAREVIDTLSARGRKMLADQNESKQK
ncbi:hypothetical protein [uncultured Thiodictyon sp.]|uniref:hypothetical protein n=1 Tax=uncultured Thiodictyon sp. TaxID=1846217 RepID=UPI0025D7708D|nr:hypothetical protein [uncultured Thiodictyon sp.]